MGQSVTTDGLSINFIAPRVDAVLVSIKVSDVPIKGFGGIAAAPAAMALIALAVKGSLVTAGASLATIVGLSRFMRSNSVLKLLTSPRLRKKEYEEANTKLD